MKTKMSLNVKYAFLKPAILVAVLVGASVLIFKDNIWHAPSDVASTQEEAAPADVTTAQDEAAPAISQRQSETVAQAPSRQPRKSQAKSVAKTQGPSVDEDLEKDIAELLGHDESSVSEIDAMLSELRIDKSAYERIVQKHARVLKELKRADETGSTLLRRLVLNDYRVWVKEELGEKTYQRFVRWTGKVLDLQS